MMTEANSTTVTSENDAGLDQQQEGDNSNYNVTGGYGNTDDTVQKDPENDESMNAVQDEQAVNTVKPLVGSVDIKIMSLPPLRAPELLHQHDNDKKIYWDRSHYESHDKQLQALAKSCTLYVGNLSFTSRTVHVRQHFALIGTVDKVIMGVDRFKKNPCGFCFVVYLQRKHALDAVALLSGTKLDGSIIRVELDAGFQNGRQFGRGQSGGQVRHDRKAAAQAQQQNRSYSNSYGNNSTSRATNYYSGDKRSRSNSNYNSSTSSNIGQSEPINDSSRLPRMDDALPTGRRLLQEDNADTAASESATDGTTTTGNVDDGVNITDTERSSNNDDNQPPPSKRQRA